MAKAESTVGEQELRKQLIALLNGGQAHATLEDAVRDFPAEHRGTVAPGLPYSAWQLVEHMRITQRDILDFSAPPTGGYHALAWPEGYWPKAPEPPSDHAWDNAIAAIHHDRETFEKLIQRPEA